MTPKRILLASHGTDGARAAEKAAYALCGPRTTLHHLIVVPDFWHGMMGDDWLNNAMTRDAYADYVESQLEDEVRAHIRKLQQETRKRRIRYEFEVAVGKPTDCVLAAAKRLGADLVVAGSPRPKGVPGLRSRLHVEKLAGALPAPLLIVPYPA